MLSSTTFAMSLLTLGAICLTPAGEASEYDNLIRQGHPALFLKSGGPVNGLASAFPASKPFKKTRLPNGDTAGLFDGFTQYLEVASTPAISVNANGAMTLEAWIRPDVLDFPSTESDGYVHWAGKGDSGRHEYALRMYSENNAAHRPNRVSAYAFNPQGGLGSGSYFQDEVRAGEWLYVAVVIDTRASRGKAISLYKNGVLRKVTPLSQFNVQPQAGDAPLRIGTRDGHSFFKGAIGKFAVYPYALSDGQLLSHYQKMRP